MKNDTSLIKNFIDNLDDKQLWEIFGAAKVELKERGLVRTNNMVGERGEFIVEDVYSNTPGLPNLQIAPEGTQNVDALSRKGERYSIKTITSPGKTTGVFYGIEKDEKSPKQKFEHLVIVILDKKMNPLNIYEVNWQTFLKYKKWHSRMRAFNIIITKSFISEAKKIL